MLARSKRKTITFAAIYCKHITFCVYDIWWILFLNKLAWISIGVFLNVTTGILIHICMTFGDVLDLAVASFRQKR